MMISSSSSSSPKTFSGGGLFCWLSLLLLLLSLLTPPSLANPLGPGAANNLKWFVFEIGAEIQCTSGAGSRCGFEPNDFTAEAQSIPAGTFQDTAQSTDISIWIPSQPADTLRVANCKTTDCIVYCFADCTCFDTETKNACLTTTAPPTQAPVPTPAPTDYVCPKQELVHHCPALMKPPNQNGSVPLVDPDCDCYNFCGTDFQSCCNALSNSCGPTDCPNKVRVQGCTWDGVGTFPNGTANPEATGTTAPPTQAPVPTPAPTFTANPEATGTAPPTQAPVPTPAPTFPNGTANPEATGSSSAVAAFSSSRLWSIMLTAGVGLALAWGGV